MTEIMETKTGRRGFLGAMSAAAAFFGLTGRVEADDKAPPKEKEITRLLMCADGCGTQLGTLTHPANAPDDQVKAAHATGTCDGCAQKRRDAYQAKYSQEQARIAAKKLTPEQARTIMASSDFASLHDGAQGAVRQVVDEAAQDLLK